METRGVAHPRTHRVRALASACALALGGGAAACSDDDGGDTVAADRVGAAAARAAGAPGTTSVTATATTATAGPAGSGTSVTTAGGATSSTLPPLPPPQIPAQASPPTTAPGTEPERSPGSDWPKVGEIVVDLEPGGHLDFPVEFRQGQHVEIMTWADNGVLHEITVHAPDGRAIATWRGGEPDTYTGYYWDEQDALPATGPYVVRVRHIGGRHEPFVLAFYSE